jgi:hypothetical protein
MFNATVRTLLITLIFLLMLSQISLAQSTAFTYQGKLTDSGNPARGNYDFQFKLFDALSSGTQIGSALTFDGNAGNQPFVVVANGIFTVQLVFVNCPSCFNGAPRFLEMAVKVHGGGVFPAPLSPRQAITSTPYAVKSMSAAAADGLSVACVNCVTSNQIASVNGSAVGGLIPVASVPAGSGNYIQNQNATSQAGDFNISGNGTAGGTLTGSIVNAATQYNLGGQRLLSTAGVLNLMMGFNAGVNNTGFSNAFFGTSAGSFNTTGSNNAFFGTSAGESNTTGTANAFFGREAGTFNTTGSGNSLFGNRAGFSNTTGSSNAFFGTQAGEANTIGSGNAFFGTNAGFFNTTGFNNAYFGSAAGVNNTTGVNNTFIGTGADFTTPNTTSVNNTLLGAQANVMSGSNATAIGANAQVTQSNSLILGSINGINNATADTNVGIGTTAPISRLHLNGNSSSFALTLTNSANTAGRRGYRLAFDNDRLTFQAADDAGNFVANQVAIDQATGNLGIGTIAPAYPLHVSGSVGVNAAQAAAEFTNSAPDTGIRLKNTAASGRTFTLFSSGGTSGLGAGTFHIYDATAGQDRLGIDAAGNVFILQLGPGSINLCHNGAQITNCSSSLRYKTDIEPFTSGLDLVRRLRPIRFSWKQGGGRDVGFAAEEVEQVEPLLTFRNDKGEIEGVKYGQLTTVLVNAMNEQQAQIEAQRKEIAALKKLVCLDHPEAEMCKS